MAKLKQCTAITLSGTRCQRNVRPGARTCSTHSPTAAVEKESSLFVDTKPRPRLKTTRVSPRVELMEPEEMIENLRFFALVPPRRITITVDGESASTVVADCSELRQVVRATINAIQRMVDYESRPKPPTWQNYDVIGVRRTLAGGKERSYTYMREEGRWPGNNSWSSLQDEEVNRLWLSGRVTHLARNGEPVA